MLKRYASSLMLIVLSTGILPGAIARATSARSTAQDSQANRPSSALSSMSEYLGRTVHSIDLPGVADRERLLQMIPQKSGQPLDRNDVRESIRILFGTGRFADIQAEVVPSGSEVLLTFATSPNFFVGAVEVEGAPSHPNANQIAQRFQVPTRRTLHARQT